MALAKELADSARARKNPHMGPRTYMHQAWEIDRALTVLYYEWVALLHIDRLAERLVRLVTRRPR
jgi:hypothetical protein